MVISHNLLALNAHRQYNIVGTQKKKSTERLSSGYRINRAADDAAGLAISEKMRRQIRGLDRASLNMKDGVSLCRTADGWLDEVHDMLQRTNQLAVKGANATLSDEDRAYLDGEVQALKDDMERCFDMADFNEIPLFHQPYTPSIIPRPEVTNFGVFHTGNLAAPGGLEINNIRYNISELQMVGMDIDDDGVANSDIEDFEFRLQDGEKVKLNLSKGSSLNDVVRNYDWKAKGDGIYVNDKKAVAWEDLSYNGVQGLADTSVFRPGKYSFPYNGMEISFSIDDRDATKDKVMFSINGDDITKPCTWDVSSGSSADRAIAPVSGGVVDQVTSGNKNDIADSYSLSANETGLAIYNETDGAYSSRIKWSDIPLSSSSAGIKTIADWGKAINSNTEVKFDNDSEFHINTNYNNVNFDFNFQLSEVSSLEEVIGILNGKAITGTLVTPGKLTLGTVPSNFGVSINTSATKNITNDLEMQKVYGRAFSSPDNSIDTLSGSIIWKKTTTSAEGSHIPGDANTVSYGTPSYSITSDNTGSAATKYYVKSVQKKDSSGNGITDSSGNPVMENRYYRVQQSVRTQGLTASRDVTYRFYENYNIQQTVALGTQSKTETQSSSIQFSRDITYQYNTSRSRYEYTLQDPDGKTLSELGMTSGQISSRLLSSYLGNAIENNGGSYNGAYIYDSTPAYSTWQQVSVGEREPISYLDSMSYDTVSMPYSAFSVRTGITKRGILNMSNGGTCTVSLGFEATGNAQRTLSPVADNTTTPEQNFDKVKLVVPKKKLDIQAGVEEGHQIRMEWSALNLTILGIAGTNTRSQNASLNAINQVKEALHTISEIRSTFGTYQNRMEHAIRLTDNVAENTTAAESQIRDTDMAKEMISNFTLNTLEQAGASMMAQANQKPETVLSLLQ